MVSTGAAMTVGVPVPSLAPYGISPDAELLYRTLATFGPSRVTALRRDLGISHDRVAAALDELSSRDAVLPHPGSGQRVWVARPPAEVVATLRRMRLRLVTGATREGGPVPGAEPPDLRGLPLGEGLRHLPSRAAARSRMAELVATARHEHVAMNTERVFDAEALRSAAPMDHSLLARGVRTRVLGLHPVQVDPLAGERRPGLAGPDYRRALEVPMKLIIVDRSVAFFPVAPDDFSRGYLEVTQAPVVSALVAMFESHWEAAKTSVENPVPNVVLAPRERALVELLAQGHTDATAARQLHISPRSVTNILRGLMDRFGVENRFQLGLALGALHSVPPPGTGSMITSEDEHQ